MTLIGGSFSNENRSTAEKFGSYSVLIENLCLRFYFLIKNSKTVSDFGTCNYKTKRWIRRL